MIKQEILKAIFNYATFTQWTSELKILVFDSDVYNIREFGVVFDKHYNILYYGYDINEAYWNSQQPPKDDSFFEISYIRDYNTNEYIFFDKNGKNIAVDEHFYKIYNEDGYIIASSENGDNVITLNGPKIIR